MFNGAKLERFFKDFTAHLKDTLPDGMIEVNPIFAKQMLFSIDSLHDEPLLTRYFQFHELEDKMVLMNHQFVIWIVPYPDLTQEKLTVFIAQNTDKTPHLELGFTTTGFEQPSKIVLKIIEKFLIEIQENEKNIQAYEKF